MAVLGPPLLPQPGAAVPTLADESITTEDDFELFVAAIAADRGVDLRYVHSPGQTRLLRTGRVLERGLNCFGATGSRAETQFQSGDFRMNAAETVILQDAVFSPRTTTVCAINRGFYSPSIRNFFLVGPTLAPMVALDPLYVLDSANQCRFSAEIATLAYSDSVAIPLCGTGLPNYGHFLYDGLPAVFMLMLSLPEGSAEIVGPPLKPWQKSILDIMGLTHRYRAMREPVLFRKVVASSMMSLHVPYPTRYARLVFDTMRFRIGGPARPASRKIFVSRGGDQTRRLLLNRAEVESSFHDAGFEIVNPETLSVPEQVRLFAGAAIVAGESGAGLANVGFCDPGTRVLEIQPTGFFEGWTRSACMLMSLEWNILFAESLPHDKEGGAALMSSVDLDELKAAIARLTAP